MFKSAVDRQSYNNVFSQCSQTSVHDARRTMVLTCEIALTKI